MVFANKIKQNKEKILFAIILFVGAILRLYRLGNYPAGLQRDEATVAMNAYNLFHNGTDFVGVINPVYMSDWGDGHSALYVWLTLIPLLLNSGEMTPFVSRLPQAIIAILTLPAVYGIGKRTLGKTFGLWIMFVTAICPWHIMMARWGLDANLAPGFLMFALYFFVRAVEKESYILLAGLFYGIALYSYACTWVVIPVVLILQIIYVLCMRKMRVDKCTVGASLILILVAIPLILFVLANNRMIEPIELSFVTIPRMVNYRGYEVTANFSTELVTNIKQSAYLLIHQTGGGEPWEILLPWGLFYNAGRILILVGGLIMIIKCIKSLVKKEFCWEIVFAIQVIGGLVTCVATYATMHRINLLFIPLLFCEAYGIYSLTGIFKNKEKIYTTSIVLVTLVFVIYTTLFVNDYYGEEYKTLVEAYMGNGVEAALNFALEQCEEKELSMITVEKAAQWPKLVLYTETTADIFTKSVVYEDYPLPWSFVTKDDILIQTRIDYNAITENSLYIIYFTDYDLFADKFELVKFEDWYVAVPRG